MSEEKAPYQAGGWSPPDYSSRDFLLDLYIPSHEMPVASSSTIGAMLSTIRQLADGSYVIHARFNGQLLGRGNYSKLGLEIIIEDESGAMVGAFSPIVQPDRSGPLCAKCEKIIVGEPSAAPSYDGPLCGSCAWEEWLIDHE